MLKDEKLHEFKCRLIVEVTDSQLMKHPHVEDELDMKRAFYELKMVREKLLIEERV